MGMSAMERGEWQRRYEALEKRVEALESKPVEAKRGPGRPKAEPKDEQKEAE